ncbi:hypothetical protein D3C73_1398020 [compost metagenome]
MVINDAEKIDIETPPKPVIMTNGINQLEGNKPEIANVIPSTICMLLTNATLDIDTFANPKKLPPISIPMPQIISIILISHLPPP